MLPSLLVAQRASAQFHVGAGLNIPKYGSVGMQPSIQARAGVDFLERKYTIAAGFNFSPTSIKETDDIPYYDASGASKNYSLVTKYNFNNFFVHAYRNFGDQENRFRFSLLTGISWDMVSIKNSIEGTAPATAPSYQASESLTTIKLDFGVAGNYQMGDNGMLFAELMTGLRANQANGQYISNPGVSHYGLTLGYKYYFGGLNNY
jgi:hypothetical protein